MTLLKSGKIGIFVYCIADFFFHIPIFVFGPDKECLRIFSSTPVAIADLLKSSKYDLHYERLQIRSNWIGAVR